MSATCTCRSAAGLHVGHLLGPLVDEEHDKRDLGVILRDGVGELLQQDRLPATRRGDDEPPLPLAKRGDDVGEARAWVAVGRLEVDALVWKARLEVVERDALFGALGFVAVDALDFEEGKVFLPLFRRPDLPGDGVTRAQIEPFDLRGGDVDVVGAVEVVPVLAAQESVAFGQNLEHALTAERDIGVEQRLLDAEDQLLFAEAGVVRDRQLFGECVELRQRPALELNDIDRRGIGPGH